MNQAISILIVDDHTMMLNALKSLLPHDSSIRVSGTATSGPEAEKKYDELHPDVVVMDVYMKPVTGIETARNILQLHPDAKVLGLSNSYSAADADELQKTGARGYIIKTAPLDAIVSCIKKVYAGELCFQVEEF
ncbi:MAG TPA: response regulator transcription factor [Chitinophagaceae bacterium]|nr:response regulator transcription factor [Chitinophagaceae bacterium]